MSRNQKILQGLQQAEQEGRLHHAYILSGPASAAKLECVEQFAARIFSEGKESEEAQVLARIRAGNHPDFTRLENLEGDVGVENVRGLPRLVAFAPLESRKRIVLIPKAASLTGQAANSVLKILEEPPAHTMFFLLCRDAGELLRTIVSRCQILRFAPLSVEDLQERLGDKNSAEERARLLGWSEGSLERAELLLNEDGALALQQEACENLVKLWESSPRIPSSTVRWSESLEGEVAEQVVIDTWEGLLADFAYIAAGTKSAETRFPPFHARLAALVENSQGAALAEISERASGINRFRVYRELNGNIRLDLAALLGELQIISVGKPAPTGIK